MNGVIEAVHVYDDNRNALLSHTYTGRPLSAAHLLPLYLEHPAPRPNLIYLPNTSPPTLVFSLSHANLLLLATSSTEIEPLLVLEFLHRIVDALEDFLGAPLLAVKIENNYDIVAQLLTEMCDAGTISTTEPNALREVVEIEGWVGKLLGSITLPGKTPLGNNLSNPSAPSLVASNTPALPWRRANADPRGLCQRDDRLYGQGVRGAGHYAQPLGPIRQTQPGWHRGAAGIPPVHGRFILAGYEVDLLPFTSGKSGSLSANNLKLPVNLDMKTGLGPAGSEFEVRLQVNKIFGSSSSSSGGQLGRGSNSGRLGGPHPGTPAAPLLDDLKITIPLPDDVRNLSDIRPSRGDASFNPGERALEWHVPAKELSGPTSHFGLPMHGGWTVGGRGGARVRPQWLRVRQRVFVQRALSKLTVGQGEAAERRRGRRAGREAGGTEQDSDAELRIGQLLGEGVVGERAQGGQHRNRHEEEPWPRRGVKPYKGVKYLTVSKGGVEIRC
ncbi:hypothetical protein ACCO45_005964 [Purpureocillium lilacinum]|uniref:Uncharacterized protein n=1 Tax=Purpureocillium lilacinum TaxID=33203 RepID=A0ACC4DWW2_PURLI